jgi:hypothetical protein
MLSGIPQAASPKKEGFYVLWRGYNMSEEQVDYSTRKQTIFRTMKDADNPFVMIDRRPIENPVLSWKAKGILTYLLSRPDNWIVRLGDLVKRSPDGVHAIRGAIKELQAAGHVSRREIRENGRFVRYELEVYELPFTSRPLTSFPHAEKPLAENRTLNDTNNNENNSNGIKPMSDNLPIEWQILSGADRVYQPDQTLAQRTDFANLVAMTTPNPSEARAIAIAFQNARNLTMPESKVKGQRKAIKEMLEMGVKAEHVEQATKDLVSKGMTVTDLFSVSKTAIDLANKPQSTKKDEGHWL